LNKHYQCLSATYKATWQQTVMLTYDQALFPYPCRRFPCWHFSARMNSPSFIPRPAACQRAVPDDVGQCHPDRPAGHDAGGRHGARSQRLRHCRTVARRAANRCRTGMAVDRLLCSSAALAQALAAPPTGTAIGPTSERL